MHLARQQRVDDQVHMALLALLSVQSINDNAPDANGRTLFDLCNSQNDSQKWFEHVLLISRLG